VSFEGLEGRIALSSVAAHALGPAAVEIARAPARHVAGSFKGSTQLVTPFEVKFRDISGKLGKLGPLTGHGFGQVSGTTIRGASLALSGAGGTPTVDLFEAPIKNGRKRSGSFTSEMLIRNATGSYAAAAGSAGKLTVTIKDLKDWFKRMKSLMTDQADVNSLSDAAYFLLNSTEPKKR
jgi:hypothetical protein